MRGNPVIEIFYLFSLKIKEQLFELLTIMAAILLTTASLQLAGCATIPKEQADESFTTAEIIEERWGIKILGIRQTTAGYMLDFRYRVIDPEKSAPLFERQTKPYLIDQASGVKFMVPNPPKTGPLRTSNKPQANRNYFIFFANPGKYVKPGNKVTVIIGDFRAENLIVE